VTSLDLHGGNPIDLEKAARMRDKRRIKNQAIIQVYGSQ
jgi:hypothetical protein